MRVALYARVSTKNNGQNPETQLVALREYAKNRGFEIAEEYVDLGVSGSKDRRPALDRMMKDARARKIDGVLVTRFDRFLKGHPKTGQRRSPQNRPMKAARDQVVLPRLAVIGQACFGTPTPWATLENVAMMEEAVEHGSHGGTIP